MLWTSDLAEWMRCSACCATRHSTGMSLSAPLYTYKLTHVSVSMLLLGIHSYKGYRVDLCTGVCWISAWWDFGIGKTLSGTIIEAKGSLNSKSPSTVEADWWGFLVFENLSWNVVCLVFQDKWQPVTYPGRWLKLAPGQLDCSQFFSLHQKENLCCINAELHEQTSCNASSQINGARLIEMRWKQTWMNAEGTNEKCLVWIDKFYFQ